jgi:glycosyltransferase involved in cell wall biosynthesis
MKKLLIATDSFLPKLDGATSFLKEIIPRLDKDFKITLMCPNYGKIKQKFNIKIVKFKPFNFVLGDIRPCFPNLSLLKKEIKNSDLVWIQGFGLIGVFSTIYAKRFNKPRVLITHILEWDLFPKAYGNKFFSVPINLATKFVGRILYNLCDVIIVPSNEIAELLTLLGIKSKKRVVHLGIDSKKFIPPKNKNQAKKDQNINENNFVVGYVGRLAYEKDLKTLYRGFQRLRRKHSDVCLLILGEGRSDITSVFENKDKVILAGNQTNVVPYYQAMDVHVLTSLTETTNLSTLEAMSCGLAVIATPVGFVKEYIKNRINGIIVPKQDSYTLFKNLGLLKNNEKLRKEIGKTARNFVIEKYSWEETVSRIKEILKEF